MSCGFLSDSSADFDNNSGDFRTQRELRLFFGYNSWQWLFLIMACIEVSLIDILTSFQMDFLLNHSQEMSSSFVINIIILVITGFSLIFLFHGVFWDKRNDICLFLVSMALITFYIIIEFAFTIDHNSTYKLTRLCISVSLTCLMIIISRMVTYYSSEYTIIGVAPALLSMFKTQCYFQILLKLDFMNAICFGLFNIGVSVDVPIPQYSVFAIIITYSSIQWVIGKIAVLKEVKCCLLLFICLCTTSLLWLPLQFIFLRSCFVWMSCSPQQMLLSYGCLFSALILVINRILLYFQLLRAHRNFGYGLSDSAFVGLVNETTRLLSRSRTRRLDL